MKNITASVIQMNSGADLDRNLARARELVLEAARQHRAELVALPEFFVLLSSQEDKKLEIAESFGRGKIQDFLSGLARDEGIHLVGGTIPLKSRSKGKVLNASLLYSPEGVCVARYDKIHLFRYRGKNEAYDETATMVRGRKVVTYDAPFGKLGLSVCYDLRFPELYRSMGRPDVVTAPTAFTVPTGRDHWDLLVRGRALENQCYLLAACQEGEHHGGRKTWGHSMIAGPWGDVLACQEQGEGVCSAVLDAEAQDRCRQRLPALDNRVM